MEARHATCIAARIPGRLSLWHIPSIIQTSTQGFSRIRSQFSTLRGVIKRPLSSQLLLFERRKSAQVDNENSVQRKAEKPISCSAIAIRPTHGEPKPMLRCIRAWSWYTLGRWWHSRALVVVKLPCWCLQSAEDNLENSRMWARKAEEGETRECYVRAQLSSINSHQQRRRSVLRVVVFIDQQQRSLILARGSLATCYPVYQILDDQPKSLPQQISRTTSTCY